MNSKAHSSLGTWAGRALGLLCVLAGLYACMGVYATGQTLLALTLLVLVGLATWSWVSPGTSDRTLALRYLLPGIAAALVFVIFPILYTVGMGFTNYSAAHLLDPERTREVLLQERVPQLNSAREFRLLRVGDDQVQIWLAGPQSSESSESVESVESVGQGRAWVTPPAPLKLLQIIEDEGQASTSRLEWPLHEAAASIPAGTEMSMRERVALLSGLRRLALKSPQEEADSRIRYTLSSLREFTLTRPLYRLESNGALVDEVTGLVYQPDEHEGFYKSAQGERLQPGYRVNVGWAHYRQIFSDEKFREPFLSVFLWTVVFSALTVLGAGALGMGLAVLLNWEALSGRGVYRVILFLPYAVPGFISILVFKGLFNQNLGEINFILHGLFGVRPAWFSDPLLAKVMLLIVNVWLGFPYMMVLCSGLIKSIAADLYEASAVEGAGPWTNFWRITLPLILKPLTPLLISAFAFNFNNFVLISLLTGGRPDQLDTAMPAGTTDILVSYTWRIAFQDSGQQFGLAAAISTVIFLIVAAITWVQMRLTQTVIAKPLPMPSLRSPRATPSLRSPQG